MGQWYYRMVDFWFDLAYNYRMVSAEEFTRLLEKMNGLPQPEKPCGKLGCETQCLLQVLAGEVLKGNERSWGDLYYRLRSEYSTGCTSVGMEGLINELATMFSDNEGGQ